MQAAGRQANEPKSVAADVVHMRVDGGDGRGHGHHRFQRVAAFGEDLPAIFNRAGMRRADHAGPMTGAVEIHHVQTSLEGSIRPRLRNNASGLGSLPRKAL